MKPMKDLLPRPENPARERWVQEALQLTFCDGVYRWLVARGEQIPSYWEWWDSEEAA